MPRVAAVWHVHGDRDKATGWLCHRPAEFEDSEDRFAGHDRYAVQLPERQRGASHVFGFADPGDPYSDADRNARRNARDVPNPNHYCVALYGDTDPHRRAAATSAPTMTPTPSNAVPPTGGGISMVPTSQPGPHTPDQVAVDAVVISRLQQRLAERRSAPVQVLPPPAQLPPVADGIYEFVMTAFTGAQQTRDDGDPCAEAEISIASSVQPSAALVGIRSTLPTP